MLKAQSVPPGGNPESPPRERCADATGPLARVTTGYYGHDVT
jgi:hypothetical protein